MLTASCAPRVHIATTLENRDAVTPEDGFRADFRVSPSSIAVALVNDGSQPIDVLWQETRIVDTAGESLAVMHGQPAPLIVRDRSDDVSRIAPGGILRDVIRPRRAVNVDASWERRELPPVECGPFQYTGYDELVGKTVRLRMTLRIGARVKLFEWTFRITRAVASVRGNRPTDPDLVPSFAPPRPAVAPSAYGYK